MICKYSKCIKEIPRPRLNKMYCGLSCKKARIQETKRQNIRNEWRNKYCSGIDNELKRSEQMIQNSSKAAIIEINKLMNDGEV